MYVKGTAYCRPSENGDRCVLRRQRASQGPQCREPLCKPRRVGPDIGLEFKRLLSFELGHLAPDSSSSSSRLAT